MLIESLWTILRGSFAYLLLLAVTRFVGRKAIAQMTFFDFAVAITFGSLTANLGIGSNNTPLNAAIVIITFGVLAVVTSLLVMKSMGLRKLVNSEPIIVIAKGELHKPNMVKARIDVNMLTSLLREKNMFNLSDVEYAILENDGKLSVLPKSNKQPLTPSDMGMTTAYKGLMTDLIVDGTLLRENLPLAGKDEAWLINALQQTGIKNYRDVFYAGLDPSGGLYLSVGAAPRENEKYGIE